MKYKDTEPGLKHSNVNKKDMLKSGLVLHVINVISLFPLLETIKQTLLLRSSTGVGIAFQTISMSTLHYHVCFMSVRAKNLIHRGNFIKIIRISVLSVFCEFSKGPIRVFLLTPC